MADDDARLAIRLARAAGLVHPRDWIKLYESHNEYEWALQQLLALLDPWGDERADFRAAVNTATQIASQQTEPDMDAMLRQIEALRRYVPADSDDQSENPETLRKISERVKNGGDR